MAIADDVPVARAAVNELSNTIDLQSTLVRAEALFRRFQRTVEAVDRKHSFPAPAVRQRKPVSDASRPDEGEAGATAGTGTGVDNGKQPGQSSAPGSPRQPAQQDRVISPELRKLLSREVEKMDGKDVVKHGGGVGSSGDAVRSNK